MKLTVLISINNNHFILKFFHFLFGFFLLFTFLSINSIFAQEDKIPEWIKKNAEWWSSDQIDDTTFLQSIKFLTEKKIISVTTQPIHNDLSSKPIPEWIKKNAEWWSSDQIDDTTFLQAIKFLIEKGIIDISLKNIVESPSNIEHILSWEELIKDAEYSWEGTLERREMFVQEGISLGIEYNANSNSASPVIDVYVIDAAIWMYMLTGEKYYLDEASLMVNDLVKYRINDKKIIGSQILNDDPNLYATTNKYSLGHIAKLAILEPKHTELVNELANAMIQYEIDPETNLFYYSISTSGIPLRTEMDFPYGGDVGIESLLLSYEATNNEKFLEQAQKTILAYWELRDERTGLLPSSVNSTSLEIIKEYMQQYGSGIFLKIVLHYYYLTEDPEALEIINDYTESIFNYVWNGKTWNYRINSDGSIFSDQIEANFPKLDDALFLIYDLDKNNLEPYNKAKTDIDNTFLNGLIVTNNGLITHSVKNDGSQASPESRLSYAFASIQNPLLYLYLDTGNKEYLEKFDMFYDSVIKHHKRNFGYVHGIDAYSLGFDEYHPNIYSVMPGLIGNKLPLTIIPSNDVTITWTTIGNTDISFPFISTFLDTGRFNRVHFDIENKEITLDKVTGKGFISFPDEIKSVLVNESTYSDFNSNILNTISGNHRYSIIFK